MRPSMHCPFANLRFTALLMAGVLAAAVLAIAGCSRQDSSAVPEVTVTRDVSRDIDLAPGHTLALHNLAGVIRIVPGSGKPHLDARIVAGGDDRAAAQALADAVHVVVRQQAGRTEAHVEYPVNQYQSFRYVHGTADQQSRDNSMLVALAQLTFGTHLTNNAVAEYQHRRIAVVGAAGQGAPLHVDITLHLPPQLAVSVYEIAGQITFAHLNNRLAAVTGSADVALDQNEGALSIRTGSGDIAVGGQHGPAVIKTGSGDIRLQQITGELDIEAGSGDIHADTLGDGRLKARSGSGDITLSQAGVPMDIKSGSGDIGIDTDKNASQLMTVTGSGDIRLGGDLSALADMTLRTGSGDVLVAATGLPAGEFDLASQSGDIAADWPGLQQLSATRHQARFKYGNGNAVLQIASGSGDIRIGHAAAN